MPELVGKGGTDESCGLESYAGQKTGFGAESAHKHGCDGGDEHGLGNGETTDEGEIEVCCTWEDIVG